MTGSASTARRCHRDCRRRPGLANAAIMIPALEAPGRHRDFRVLALSLRLTVAVARPAEPGNDAASEVTVTTHRRFTTVAV